MDSYQIVLDFLKAAAQPVTAAEVAAATGLDKKEIDKAMKLLKKEERIVSPKRCYWEFNK